MRGHVGVHVGCGGGDMSLRPGPARGLNLGARGTCMVTWQPHTASSVMIFGTFLACKAAYLKGGSATRGVLSQIC